MGDPVIAAADGGELAVAEIAESPWWRHAVVGNVQPVRAGVPEPGFYRTRLVQGGPFVPARIWIVRTMCPATREPMADDVYHAIAAGRPVSVWNVWPWWGKSPISRADYDHMEAVRTWATAHAPNDPAARPLQAVTAGELPVYDWR